MRDDGSAEKKRKEKREKRKDGCAGFRESRLTNNLSPKER